MSAEAERPGRAPDDAQALASELEQRFRIQVVDQRFLGVG
jgi:hypothetical protein